MEVLLFLPLVILTTLVRVIVLLKSSITQALMDTVEVTLPLLALPFKVSTMHL